jgi:ribonuclease VapC
MIVDSSALVSIIYGETDSIPFSMMLDSTDTLRISAATFLETSVVVDARKSPVLSNRVEDLIARFNIVIEPVTAEQARIARQAYRDFGKGSGHRANLNFGDCFAYALARVKREPLLYKGDDFVHTDLRSALQQL